MFKYELTMVNGEKFIYKTYIKFEEFIGYIQRFSGNDEFITDSDDNTIRCKYIASIKERK
ncbi:MAG: hypothetical protein ACRCXT_15760 [Paraclostridium sp.]